MGEKIAEGAQDEIFNCKHDEGDAPLLWKVFKRQFSLLDLQMQWPHGMFENANSWSYGKDNVCIIWGILLLDDRRFAIEMLKYWGDLRKFIDDKMQQNNNQNPPFTKEVAKLIMWDIAKGMRNLHRDEILHRDLKAADVLIDNSFRLLRGNIFDAHKNNFACRVADFECSVGGSRARVFGELLRFY
jgi:serine/threonine protein kinase